VLSISYYLSNFTLQKIIKHMKELLIRITNYFAWLCHLNIQEVIRIKLMSVILSGYSNRLAYASRRPFVHSPEVYIGLIGFKAETLRRLFQAEVSLYAIYTVLAISNVTQSEKDHCINAGVLCAISKSIKARSENCLSDTLHLIRNNHLRYRNNWV